MRVIFRATRSGDFKGDVTAILPDVEANRGHIVCYDHIGQHSECSFGWYQETRAAKPTEYADLLAELQQIYDNELVVRQRLSGPVGGWRQ
jgi:hypothetical protein